MARCVNGLPSIRGLAFFLVLGLPAWAAEPPIQFHLLSATRPRTPFNTHVASTMYVQERQTSSGAIEFVFSSKTDSTRTKEESFRVARNRVDRIHSRLLIEMQAYTYIRWRVEFGGVSQDSLVVCWNVYAKRNSSSGNEIHIESIRPIFFVGDGHIVLQRDLTEEEVDKREVVLTQVQDYLHLQDLTSPGLSEISSRNPTAPFVMAWQPPSEALHPIFWLPSVVLLREESGTRQAQALPATLFAGFAGDHSLEGNQSFLLTFINPEGQREQVALPVKGLARIRDTIRAYHRFEPIRVGDQLHNQNQPIRLETLVVDVREGGEPLYHFLYRGNGNYGTEGKLLAIDAAQMVPERLPDNRARVHAPHFAAQEHTVQALLAEYQHWYDREEAPFQSDNFHWFLSQSKVLGESKPTRDSFSNVLEAQWRLIENHSLSESSSLITHTNFQMLHYLNREQRETPSRSLFCYRTRFTRELRFRGGPAMEYAPLYCVDLDSQVARPRDLLLNIISQSRTGKNMLRFVVPSLRNRTLRLVPDDENPESPSIRFEKDKEFSVMRINTRKPLGESIAPLIRSLALSLRLGAVPLWEQKGYSSSPMGHESVSTINRLTALRESYEATAIILRELLLFNPGLIKYVKDHLSVPSNQELMQSWNLAPDEVVKENKTSQGTFCAATLQLLGASSGQRVDFRTIRWHEPSLIE